MTGNQSIWCKLSLHRLTRWQMYPAYGDTQHWLRYCKRDTCNYSEEML